MCNCRELPSSVAELEYRVQGFQFKKDLFQNHYFETPDSDRFEPPLDFSQSMYRCMECNQAWYIECTPQENPSPEFALKVDEIKKSSSDEALQAAKQYLCILAHGGFDSEKRRMTGCQNHKLYGRELCHLHIPFP